MIPCLPRPRLALALALSLACLASLQDLKQYRQAVHEQSLRQAVLPDDYIISSEMLLERKRRCVF